MRAVEHDPAATLRALLPAGQPNRPTALRPLCDFAKAASALQALPLAEDAVFRAPHPRAKAELGRLRKQPQSEADLASGLRALLAERDGPAVARLAVQDKDPRLALAAIRAAVPLAFQHPRLYAFLPTLDARTPTELALALVAFDFATRCDTPILFALDALHHLDGRVVAAAAHAAVDLAEQTTASAPLNRVVQWLAAGKGPAGLRVAIARRLGNAGYLHLLPLWQKLAGDPDPAVVAEAQVAAARLAPADARIWVAAALADRAPWRQVTALRAAAIAYALDPAAIASSLEKPCAGTAIWRDPASGAPVQVAAVCKRARAILRAEPVD